MRKFNGQFTSLGVIGEQIFKRLCVGYTLLGLVVFGGILGMELSSMTPKAEAELVYIENSTIPPVMERIAKCESKNRQFNDDGMPIEYVNMSGKYAGTVDVGYFGINRSIWGKKAKELGYNIYEEDGNKKMGMWLFENYGTEPWSYTSGPRGVGCW